MLLGLLGLLPGLLVEIPAAQAQTDTIDVCDRVQGIRRQILERESSITASDCSMVSRAELEALTEMRVHYVQQLAGIQASDFANMQALKTLRLEFCGAIPDRTWPAGVFVHLTNLRTLSFEGCDISSFAPGAFRGLTELRELNLRELVLQDMHPGTFEGLDNLETLDLRGNSFGQIGGPGLTKGVFDDILNTVQNLQVDNTVRNNHFVCRRSDAADIVAATDDVTDCLRISAAQFETAVNPNAPGAPTLENQSVMAGSSFTYTFAAVTDPDGDAVTYAATLADDTALPSWLTFTTATRTFSGTPTEGDVGMIEVRVTAMDDVADAMKSSSANFAISVTNEPPSMPVLEDQTATTGRAFTYTLDAVTDPNGNTLTYAATLADGTALPGWLMFDANTRTFSGTPATGDIDMIEVRVTAMDGATPPLSSMANFTISVLGPEPPSVPTLEPPVAVPGMEFTWVLMPFIDPNGDTVTYEAELADGSSLPGWLTFTPGTRTFSGTPTESDQGRLEVRITATDDGAPPLSSEAVVTISVGLASSDAQRKEAERSLGDFGRGAMNSTVSAIAGRIEAGSGASGQSPVTALMEGLSRKARRNGGDRTSAGLRTEKLDDLLRLLPDRLAFGEGDGGRGSWSVWVQGGLWKADSGTRDTDITSVHAGADIKATDRLTAGVAVSHSAGDGSFAFDNGVVAEDWTLYSELTSVLPYVGFKPSPWSQLWATGGFGWGSVKVGGGPDGNDLTGSSDLEATTLAAGGRHDLLRNSRWRLALQGDAAWSSLETEGGESLSSNLDASVNRLRAGLEASTELSPQQAVSIAPFISAGVRHDDGTGISGTGLEVDGGMRLSGERFSIEAKAHTVVTHSEDRFDESGASLQALVRPLADGSGLSLRLEPRWGVPAASSGSVLSDHYDWTVDADSAPPPGSALSARLGYGVLLSSGRYLVTPFLSYVQPDVGRQRMLLGTEVSGTGALSGLRLRFETGTKRHGEADRSDTLLGIEMLLRQ